MSLNILEYDELLRIRSATEAIARNASNSVSMERFAELRRAFDMMIVNHDNMQASRDYWKREYDTMADNRDTFRDWGRKVKAEAEEQIAALRARAEQAEAELAALRASLAPPSYQG